MFTSLSSGTNISSMLTPPLSLFGNKLSERTSIAVFSVASTKMAKISPNEAHSAIRAVVVDLADIVHMPPELITAVKQHLKRFHPGLEAWPDADIANAIGRGTIDTDAADFLTSRKIQLPNDSGLASWDPDSEMDGDNQRSIVQLVNSVNDTLVEFLEKGPMPCDMPSVTMLRNLKVELACLVGAVWSAMGTRVLLEQAGLMDLFDAVVDKSTQDSFGLRSQPAPDTLLKLCSDMAVSPYETVGIFTPKSQGVVAASTGTFGLVVGRPSLEEMSFADQKRQMLKQGADVVVNDVSEVHASMLSRWYDSGIHEDAWNMVYTAYNPESELYREALTALGNGYMGNRGVFEGSPPGAGGQNDETCHYAGTYIGGVFNTVEGERVPDAPITSQAVLVNLPNWCLIEIKINDGDFIRPLEQELLYYQHNISFKDGLLERSVTFRSAGDRETRLDVCRIVSMKHCHTAAIKYTVTPLNYTATITLRSAIDSTAGGRHLEVLSAEQQDTGILLLARTPSSNVHIGVYAKHTLYAHGLEEALQFTDAAVEQEALVAEEFTFSASADKSYTLEKLVSIFTSRDLAFEGFGTSDSKKVCQKLTRLNAQELRHIHNYSQIYEPHRQSWAELWDKADIFIEGDRLAQKMVRLNTYHLLIAASPHRHRMDAGLSIKGLAGEGCGHVMWDELFQFPFYLTKFPKVHLPLPPPLVPPLPLCLATVPAPAPSPACVPAYPCPRPCP